MLSSILFHTHLQDRTISFLAYTSATVNVGALAARCVNKRWSTCFSRPSHSNEQQSPEDTKECEGMEYLNEVSLDDGVYLPQDGDRAERFHSDVDTLLKVFVETGTLKDCYALLRT